MLSFMPLQHGADQHHHGQQRRGRLRAVAQAQRRHGTPGQQQLPRQCPGLLAPPRDACLLSRRPLLGSKGAVLRALPAACATAMHACMRLLWLPPAAALQHDMSSRDQKLTTARAPAQEALFAHKSDKTLPRHAWPLALKQRHFGKEQFLPGKCSEGCTECKMEMDVGEFGWAESSQAE